MLSMLNVVIIIARNGKMRDKNAIERMILCISNSMNDATVLWVSTSTEPKQQQWYTGHPVNVSTSIK